jgi:hypothetical protein
MMRRTALIASAVTAILLWLSPIAQAQTSDEPAQSAVPDFSAVDGHSLAAAPATEAAAPAKDEAAAPAKEKPATVVSAEPVEASVDKPLDSEMEDVKKALLKLKRDLVILEEDLLFPASSQVSVFLSMDLGDFFQLDSVVLKLNGKEVASHLYTDKQIDALYRGGVQKVYVGNVKQGDNSITAFFTGRGPSGRDYRRATTVDFEKSFEPTFVELAISDSTAKYQPEFRAAVSN